MSFRGSCLCGTVHFEVDEFVGPFEICHCSRCRKTTGSTGMAAVEVARDSFRFTAGESSIGRFEAPMLYGPPAYVVPFCRECGSPLPDPLAASGSLEIPAGLLDDDPHIQPDRHIFVDFKAPWETIDGALPQFTRAQIYRHRTESSE